MDMGNCRFCHGFSFICLNILMGCFIHLNAEALYVRVVDGLNGNQGKVEVYDNETSNWYPICRDTWDDHAANVVCRMLGYTRVSGFAMKTEQLKQGWNRNVSCKGSESLLSECELTQVNVQSCFLAGVDCSKCGSPEGFFLMGGNDNVIRMDDTTWAYIKIPKPDSNEIRGLSYDSQSNAIYWTDRSNVIKLSLATGKNVTMFTKENDNSEYLGLAVDINKRLLFFGDYNNADIWKVDLDSSEEKVKILDTTVNVQHIEVDPKEEKIYWLDLHNEAMIRADYNGKNSRIVLKNILYFGINEMFTLDDEFVYIAQKKSNEILVYGKYVTIKRYIDISMYRTYKGITQWNDHIYLISSKESRLIKVNKDGSSVELTGPPIKDFHILSSLRHYTSTGITISTTTSTSTKYTTENSPTTTLPPNIAAKSDIHTGSMSTTLPPSVANSEEMTTATATVSKITSNENTPELTTTVEPDTASSESPVGGMSTTLPPSLTNSKEMTAATTTVSKTTSMENTPELTTAIVPDIITSESNVVTIVIAVFVAVGILILEIGLGILIYHRCCKSLSRTTSDKDNYLNPVSTLQEQENEVYDIMESTNTVSNNIEDEPVYCEILPEILSSTLPDHRIGDITSSDYLEPVSVQGYKRNSIDNAEEQETVFSTV